ncbi:MAG: transposase [Chloroflexota bacterium]
MGSCSANHSGSRRARYLSYGRQSCTASGWRLLGSTPAQQLVEEFVRLVRERDKAALGPWLPQAEGSALAEFREFAIVLRRDLAAVEAALMYIWSNGQAEGQINRLKLLKRQMYGRASLALPRCRFLKAA